MFSVSCVKEPVIQLWEIIPFIYCFFPPHFHSGLKGQSTWRDLTLLVPPSGEKEQLASGHRGVFACAIKQHVQKKKIFDLEILKKSAGNTECKNLIMGLILHYSTVHILHSA